jgi:hypothetical protein
MTGLSPFLPFRVLDTSLTVCGSVYMNERPKLGSGKSGLNVQLWVLMLQIMALERPNVTIRVVAGGNHLNIGAAFG